MYIIEFPHNWFMREIGNNRAIAAGTAERATQYGSETEAVERLAKCAKSFKRTALNNAKIVRAPFPEFDNGSN